jgi:hypothetical protein
VTSVPLHTLTEDTKEPVRRMIQALADANELGKGSTQMVSIAVIRQRRSDGHTARSRSGTMWIGFSGGC